MNPACRILGYRRYRIAAQDATAVLELCRASVIRLAGGETDCTVDCEQDAPETFTL